MKLNPVAVARSDSKLCSLDSIAGEFYQRIMNSDKPEEMSFSYEDRIIRVRGHKAYDAFFCENCVVAELESSRPLLEKDIRKILQSRFGRATLERSYGLEYEIETEDSAGILKIKC